MSQNQSQQLDTFIMLPSGDQQDCYPLDPALSQSMNYISVPQNLMYPSTGEYLFLHIVYQILTGLSELGLKF